MKKIKKNLSNLFKHIVRKIFILFNGKIITLDNKSIFLDMGINKTFVVVSNTACRFCQKNFSKPNISRHILTCKDKKKYLLELIPKG